MSMGIACIAAWGHIRVLPAAAVGGCVDAGRVAVKATQIFLVCAAA